MNYPGASDGESDPQRLSTPAMTESFIYRGFMGSQMGRIKVRAAVCSRIFALLPLAIINKLKYFVIHKGKYIYVFSPHMTYLG